MFGNPVRGEIKPRGTTVPLGTFVVTATFAEHIADGRNPGVDIGDHRCGDDLIAMTTGVVSLAGFIGSARVVRIVSDDYPEYEVAVAHNASITVVKGQHVRRGDKIGTLGMSGAEACHCHMGCKKNGVEIDIWPLLDQNKEEDVLQGTNPRPVENRKVLTSTGADGLRFRSSPFVKADNILVTLPNGTEVHPDFIVDGTRVGASADPKWYGAWVTTPKGKEFAYASVVFFGPATPIESTGFTQAQLDAAKAAGRAAGIQAARDDLKDTV